MECVKLDVHFSELQRPIPLEVEFLEHVFSSRHLTPMQMFDHLKDTLDVVTNLDRIVSLLTSHDLKHVMHGFFEQQVAFCFGFVYYMLNRCQIDPSAKTIQRYSHVVQQVVNVSLGILASQIPKMRRREEYEQLMVLLRRFPLVVVPGVLRGIMENAALVARLEFLPFCIPCIAVTRVVSCSVHLQILYARYTYSVLTNVCVHVICQLRE